MNGELPSLGATTFCLQEQIAFPPDAGRNLGRIIESYLKQPDFGHCDTE